MRGRTYIWCRLTKKNHDKVHRKVVWRFLEARGIPQAYIRVIKDMYVGVKTRVRTIAIGFHQLLTLGQFLFALMIGELVRHIQVEVPWCMLFANDIVLIDEIHEGVNARLEVQKQTLKSIKV